MDWILKCQYYEIILLYLTIEYINIKYVENTVLKLLEEIGKHNN